MDLLARLAEMIVVLVAVAYGVRLALLALGFCIWGMDRAWGWWKGGLSRR